MAVHARRFSHEPQPGETRDCLDPWKLVFVKADGGVHLCCWSQPIGNVRDGRVGEILNSEPAREMRRGLLAGDIPSDCVDCGARALVPVETLRKKVERFMAEDDRQELIETRSTVYALQNENAEIRRDLASVDEHVLNLEDERDHMQAHVELLTGRLDAITEGRTGLFGLMRAWCRGRLRRSAIGRWWIAR